VQAVAEIFDRAAAAAFGLAGGQVCVMIHCGSRGLCHQVCTDHVQLMDKAMARYGITVPDRQLACAPADSPEGRAYLAAMAAAANYGRANRQLLSQAAREVFARAAGAPLHLVYDLSQPRRGRNPRRAAAVRPPQGRHQGTLSPPPGHPALPADLRDTGQPVLIPGSMGTCSHVLAGVTGADAFASACHGAGRPLLLADRAMWSHSRTRDGGGHPVHPGAPAGP
jgi:tRNA-splicing ligase RtcB (3'-phosphate/5'-hydroxy nucleic acid ligase)